MRCPYCKSEYTYYSNKRQTNVCEDCGKSFSEKANPHLRLFFSYGHDSNSVVVELIKEALRERGHEVWIDHDHISIGSDWRQQVMDGILGSDGVVSFLTRHSVRDPGACLDELRIALCVRNANVRTVMLERDRDTELPASIASRQWLDMREWRTYYDQGGEIWDEWFKARMFDLIACLESPEMVSFEGELRELEKTLKPASYGNREHDLLVREFYGRKWLLDEVVAWERSGVTRCFALVGVPGSGKSAFASHLVHYDSSVVASVFFEYGRRELANFDAVTRLLSFQLASKLPDYRSQLLNILERRRDEVDSVHDESLFDLLVGYPLRNVINRKRGAAMVVLDSLDEAAELDGGFVERLLVKLRELPEWVTTFVTTRPESSILSLLDQATLHSIDAADSNNADDIKGFLTSIASSDDVASRLAVKCEGSFLYATMLLSQISSGELSEEEALSQQGGLASFYHLNFSKRFTGSDSYRAIRPALELICGSTNLPRACFCDVMGFDTYDFIAFRKALGSFVVVDSTELYSGLPRVETLALVHKSLKDWLVDEGKSNEFYVDEKSGMRRLGERFLSRIHDGLDSCSPTEGLYIVNNLDLMLVGGGLYGAYVDYLQKSPNVGLPSWRSIAGLPSNSDFAPLIEKLEESFSEIEEEIRHARYDATTHYIDVCKALYAGLAHDCFVSLFEDFLLSRNGLWCPTRYFFSGASDTYNHGGLPGAFNLDKILIARVIADCYESTVTRGVRLPKPCNLEVQMLKLSSLFYDGVFDDGAEVAISNLGNLFCKDICELSEEDIKFLEDKWEWLKELDVRGMRNSYNTLCLYKYLQACDRSGKAASGHVERSIRFGADYDEAKHLAKHGI